MGQWALAEVCHTAYSCAQCGLPCVQQQQRLGVQHAKASGQDDNAHVAAHGCACCKHVHQHMLAIVHILLQSAQPQRTSIKQNQQAHTTAHLSIQRPRPVQQLQQRRYEKVHSMCILIDQERQPPKELHYPIDACQ